MVSVCEAVAQPKHLRYLDRFNILVHVYIYTRQIDYTSGYMALAWNSGASTIFSYKLRYMPQCDCRDGHLDQSQTYGISILLILYILSNIT